MDVFLLEYRNYPRVRKRPVRDDKPTRTGAFQEFFAALPGRSALSKSIPDSTKSEQAGQSRVSHYLINARCLSRSKASVVNGEKRCQPKNPDILREDVLKTRPSGTQRRVNIR
jgi:hypothetical protein